MPVLLEEVLDLLNIRETGTYVDCTLGGGGHFWAIASRLSEGATLVGVDRDEDAVDLNRKRIGSHSFSIVISRCRFSQFDTVLKENGIGRVDGFVLDLGVSSHQIDEPERGFSYMQDSVLDMRMDRESGVSAKELLLRSSQDELADILGRFGEIRNPSRMARALKEWLTHSTLDTSRDIQECIKKEYGPHVKYKVLSKLFQALRIAVNRELEELKMFLEKSLKFLAPGGRLAVISYHSLEDRIVKEFIRANEGRCECPSDLPVCVCDKPPLLKRVNRKVVVPGDEELKTNPRSRSARLRVVSRTSLEG
ncbi:rRNA small subunit methyltransferase H [Chitinispirillum alkaliphilum]|nr:rRNA small subunit methyltransferase H [Chitinispirillum alkaliphilum]